jgi:hypothetical protein
MSASELRADIEATTPVLVLVPIIMLIGSYRCPFRAKSSTQCRIVQGLRIKTLFEAMKQIAETGQGPKEQIPSMGCSIKWKR